MLWEKGSKRVRKQRCKSDEMKEGSERRGEEEDRARGGPVLAGGDGNKAAKVCEHGAKSGTRARTEGWRSEGRETRRRESGGKKEKKRKEEHLRG